ncbi:MAG TPA: XRE family transcriptional regulator [Polyangiales bacterium]
MQEREINAVIARRVRSLRAAGRLSLAALSTKCDVSRSMLSLVERGESSPTASVLDKIATGLGVPLAALFSDPAAAIDPISTRRDRRTWRDPQSGYVRSNISPPNFPSPIQIAEVRMAAGARVAYDTGAREVGIHQQIWVREGNIEVTVGRAIHRLAKDDCLAMQLNEPTAFRNRSRKLARYVVVIATEHAVYR